MQVVGRLHAKAAADGAVEDNPEPATGVKACHIYAMLRCVFTGQGLRAFHAEMANLRGARGDKNYAPGNDNKMVARQIITAMSCWEKRVTRVLLEGCSVISLAQDARDPRLLLGTKSVLWHLPPALEGFSLPGCAVYCRVRAGRRQDRGL